MTLEEKLVALLQAICPRTFPDFAPTDTARPYVTWQQIGGDAIDFFDNALPSKENALVQVNVWSDRRAEAKGLIKQIENALITSTAFDARPTAAAASDADSDMQRYCSRQDFSVWADRQ
jgi:hypothetical protein